METVELTPELVSKLTDEYQEYEKVSRQRIAEIKARIANLKKEYFAECDRNIFNIIYQPEYGDINYFVEKISEELRKRDKIKINERQM